MPQTAGGWRYSFYQPMPQEQQMDHSLSQIAEMDRASVLHPFTQAKDYASGKAGDPTIITGGKGIRIQDAKGNSYIDGFAGLYCVNVGYGRDEVADAPPCAHGTGQDEQGFLWHVRF
jgi:4-aminobutyrate aminotransferase-like enzyme